MQRLFATFASLLLLLGCQPAGSTPAVSRTLEHLVLETPGSQFPTGSAFQLKAFGLYDDGSKVDVTGQAAWTSTRVSVGQVGPSGIVQLGGVGETKIEARFEDRYAAVSVTSTAAVLTALELTTGERGELARGDERRFVATGVFSDGSRVDVTASTTWEADGVAVATTSTSGVIRGLREGTGVVTGAWYSQRSSVQVQVGGPRFTGLALEAPARALRPGDAVALAPVARFSDGSQREVTAEAEWRSSDDTVVMASGGMVVARAAGRARVTAVWSGVAASVEVVVDARQVVAVRFSLPQLALAQGRAGGLDLFAEFDDGNTEVVSQAAAWSTSDETVAVVSPGGSVATASMGVTQITARYGTLHASYLLEVTAPVLEHLSVTLPPGRILLTQSVDLFVVATFSDGAQLNVSLTAAAAHGAELAVDTVSDRVRVAGAQVGAAPLTFSLGGVQTTLALEVSAASLVGLSIQESNGRPEGSEPTATVVARRFRAIATYSDGAELDVTEQANWWADDANAVVVSDLPGTRGTYQLADGGTTSVRTWLAGTGAALAQSFSPKP